MNDTEQRLARLEERIEVIERLVTQVLTIAKQSRFAKVLKAMGVDLES